MTLSHSSFKSYLPLKVFSFFKTDKKIFIVGPPGFKVREFALQVADHYKFTTISVGDLLRKEVSKKL